MNNKLAQVYYKTLADTFQGVTNVYIAGYLIGNDPLKALQKLCSIGDIWTLATCEILSIEMPKVGTSYRYMHISKDVVTVYEASTKNEAYELRGQMVFEQVIHYE